MINRYTLFFAIFLIGLTQNLNAQKFDRITLDYGLSQSNINCIIQDQTGFIWFGTNGGLNRFDGSEFKIFLHDIYDSLSISNNIINALHEGPEGNIWIGTQNGLNVYDPYTNQFKIYKSEVNNPKSLSSNIITSITSDQNGTLWIGTDGGGVNKFNQKTGDFTVFQYNIQNPYSISSNKISALELDKYGFLWIGTSDNGLNMMDTSSGKCLRYVNDEHSQFLSGNNINVIYEDNDEDLWIGTTSGLNKMIPAKSGRSINQRDRIQTYTHNSQINSIGGNSILSIYQGASGLLWIGTYNGGLSSFNKSARYFVNYSFDPNQSGGLLSNKITALLDDKSEILWIGTNAGINKIDRQGDRFKLHVRKPGLSNTWSSNNVQSVYKELNGIIWVGTFDAGLNKYNPRTGEYTIYKSDDIVTGGVSLAQHRKVLRKNNRKSRRFETNRFLSNNRVLCIHRDLNRTLWVGTGGGGLNKLDLRSGEITWYKAEPENPDGLSNNYIKTIYEDSKGVLWLGTEGGGVNRFTDGKFKRYLYNEHDVLSLSSNHVNAITEDKEGNLWIGTFGGGLNKFNPENESFERFTHSGGKNEISSNSVYCLYADNSNRLWIGTNDGLNMLNLETNEFRHFTIRNDLPSNFIYGILGDQQGNLWISTNKGISKFNVENEEAKNYDHLDGLQGQEFNPGSCYQTKKGEMLFGGINGFNSFYPEKIKDNSFIPDVILTDFKILGESVKINKTGSPLDEHISFTEKINLSHEDNAISFEFVALNFTNSEKNQYAYMLENFEDKWNYVGTRRFASYTNLPPGEYIFKVKASNNDNIWNEQGTSLTINIEPPFYKTWWFYLLSAISILVMAYLVVIIRVRNLQRTKTMLREVVKARTKQLSEEKSRVERAHSEIMWQKNEIESQRNLLMTNNKELVDAKKQLDNANEELIAINSNLESIVQERTEKLRKAYEKLIKANNELDLFIYRASHDLKGPIASLLGLTRIAKLDELPPSTDNYINKMEMGAEQLDKVLNKLTNIHFINKSDLELSEITIRGFMDQIFHSFHPSSRNGVNFFNEIDPGLKIQSDEKIFKIICENIVENAITFKKPIEPALYISNTMDKDGLKIVFEDNGIGIPEEYQKRIFEMFYRASDLSKGSGLGLYLVHKSAEKLDYKIDVNSEKGKHSTFTLIIPLEGKNIKKKNARINSKKKKEPELVDDK